MSDIPASMHESGFIESGELSWFGNLVLYGAPGLFVFHIVFSALLLIKRKITLGEYLVLGAAPLLVGLLTLTGVYFWPEESWQDYYDYYNF